MPQPNVAWIEFLPLRIKHALNIQSLFLKTNNAEKMHFYSSIVVNTLFKRRLNQHWMKLTMHNSQVLENHPLAEMERSY